MAKDTPDTVVTEGRLDDHREGVAVSAVTPGMVLEKTGTDTSGAKDEPEVQPNSNDGENRVLRVALMEEGVGKSLDDDIPSGDKVWWRELVRGEEFQGLVFDGSNAAGSGTDLSANANISDGDRLVLYGGAGANGTFRAYDGDNEGAVLVEAQEAVDNSSATEPARIPMKVV